MYDRPKLPQPALQSTNLGRLIAADREGQHDLWCPDLLRKRQPGPFLAGKPWGAGTGFSTRAVHAGQYDDPHSGAVGTPIFQSSTFLLGDSAYQAIKDGNAREQFIYSRYGNPSQWALQEKLASLEGAESAVVFSSGMAAITTTLLALLDKGGHVVTSRDLYGGTYSLLNETLPQLGMRVSFVDPTDLAAIEAAITDRTQLLFFESLSNPLLKVLPVQAIVDLAKRHHCRVVIDNTFLTPYNLQPLWFGVDVVVNSASKYLNGHSDLIAGSAAGSRKLLDRIWGQMLKFGGNLDPHACFLFERGLKTFALRMREHNANALAVARFLEGQAQVARVSYPGLASHAQHQLAAAMLEGASGVVSFEVVGGNTAAHRLLEALRIPRQATSLGGLESLISLPYNTSHAQLTTAQLAAIGIRPGLVRLSVGVEDEADLIADLRAALAHIQEEVSA